MAAPRVGETEAPPDPGPSQQASPPARPAWSALMAGIAAGLIAWGTGEILRLSFAPPAHLVGALERSVELLREQNKADLGNAMVAFGLLGSATGMALGIAGGLSRRSIRASAIAGGVGLLAGVATGVGSTRLVAPILARNPVLVSENVLAAILFNGIVWSAVGSAGGLAFAIGRGDRRGMMARSLFGAVTGAILGVVLFNFLGAIAFPLARTDRLIPLTTESRFLARMMAGVLVGLGVALAVRGPRSSPAVG